MSAIRCPAEPVSVAAQITHGDEQTLSALTERCVAPLMVDIDEPLETVARAFQSTPEPPGAVVFFRDVFVVALPRPAVERQLAKPFRRDLFIHKSVGHFIEYHSLESLVLNSDTPVVEAINIALSRESERRYEPIVVIEANDEVSLLDMHVLLFEQCIIQEQILTELQAQREATRKAKQEREAIHNRLIETSREAGMAEIASSILHNVGNVLNSVNISTGVVGDKLRQSKVRNLERAVDLIREHEGDLPFFLENDEKGKKLPGYLGQLANVLNQENESILEEVTLLTRSIEHIGRIVHSQQAYATGAIAIERVNMSDLIEDAIRMTVLDAPDAEIEVCRSLEQVPLIETDKHLILQVLVNLICNAKLALREQGGGDRRITIKLNACRNGEAPCICVDVEDTGVGIAPENLTRIFQHGFSTREDGRGLGLHNAANSVQQLGGSIESHSDGPGHGARFSMRLPVTFEEATHR